MAATANPRFDSLLARREQFIAFLTPRLGGNRADAEDLLQSRLAQALVAAPKLREHEKLVPWFYQVLRHAAVDHIRSRRAMEQRDAQWIWNQRSDATGNSDDPAQLCTCIAGEIDALPARQARLLRRVELDLQPLRIVAAELGLTPNAAAVSLHRARRRLRAGLEALCGECAETGCLDCDCAEASPKNN